MDDLKFGYSTYPPPQKSAFEPSQLDINNELEQQLKLHSQSYSQFKDSHMIYPGNLQIPKPIPKRDSNTFHVVIRIKPVNEAKAKKGEIIDVGEDMQSLIIGKDLDKTATKENRYPSYQFTFDRVFEIGTTQSQFYNKCISPLVKATLDGVNTCCFVYGQTNSGKTYTLEGQAVSENRGMIPRAVEEIFTHIRAFSPNGYSIQYNIRVSYVQLYNETVTDLLSNKKQALKVLDTADKKASYIPGVVKLKIKTVGDIYDILKRGRQNRTVLWGSKPPDLHAKSHTIFTIYIEKIKPIVVKQSSTSKLSSSQSSAAKKSKSSVTEEVVKSKLNFVELAGSEKVKDFAGREESSKIAASFNALATVVAFLSRPGHHVPYRDSKLTYILKDSITPESICLFIAQLYPTRENYVETLATAKYASRIRQSASFIQNVQENRELQSTAQIRMPDVSTISSRSSSRGSFGTSKSIFQSSLPQTRKPAGFSIIDASDTAELDARQKLKIANQKIEQINNEKTMLEKQIDQLKRDAEMLYHEKEDLKLQIVQKCAELERAKEDFSNAQREIINLQYQLDKKQEENELLQRQLLSKNSATMKEKEQIDTLRSELIFLKNELAHAREERDLFRKENEENKTLLSKEIDQRKSYQLQVDHWKLECERIELERRNMRDQIVEFGRTIDKLTDMNTQLKQSLLSSKRDIEIISQLKEKIENEATELREKVFTLQSEKDSLNKEIIALENKEGIDKASQDVDALRTDNQLLKMEISKLKEELQKARRECLNEDSKQYYISELNKLKQELSLKDSELLFLTDENKRLHSQVKESEMELRRVRSATEKTNKELKSIISSFGL